MIRYKLTLGYNGKGFSGWQSQPQLTSIQDHIEDKLRLIISCNKTRVTAASRTDSGVHAEEQIAVFDHVSEIDEPKTLKSLNSLLSPQVRIFALEKTFGDFNPIGACTGKIYRYRILQNDRESPFFSDYIWTIKKRLDVDKMNACAAKMNGVFDFSAFCASDSNAKTKVREVFESCFEERGDSINFWISGSGFLKQMVRSLVGTFVDIGSEKLSSDRFWEFLETGKRGHEIKTAPANGLSLVKLFYGERVLISNLIKRAEHGFNQTL